MKIKHLILTLLSLLILSGCNQRSKKSTRTLIYNENTRDVKEESFDEFSKLFYSDSLYQINRIIFPLESDIDNSASNESKDSTIYVWKKENWIMLKNNYFKGNDSVFIIDGEVYKTRIHRTNRLVVESIYIEDSGYIITMKFLLRNGKWHLIDYTECNN